MTSDISDSIRFTQPELKDGLAVTDLIQNSPPLDLNSSYCYMLCCSLWAETSVCAWDSDKLIGFVSAFIRPDQPEALFIWQVAVDESARGKQLAKRMIFEILKRPASQPAKVLHTTISPDNTASWRMFAGLTRALECESRTFDFLDKELHFHGLHESEELLEIGPFRHP
ncbi:diaminobutyrate acetyltransferase [Oceanospirillum sanctuarii]|uniref:diaminobutyrate acetyltransferase n=1 Tax=Oceanospirillum sanctuarii TaxID=1434821 RepID=UPI000A39F936|nr:diaminobutyrate acetyltransferase [Oceanospirillum sanctuarii]